MIKMTAPENAGSVNVQGNEVHPDCDGCLYIPDDCPTDVLEDLRSHGYTLVGWVPNSGQSSEDSGQKKSKR